MVSYRKAKLAVDAFRSFASKIITRAPTGEASQGLKRQPHSSISGTNNTQIFGLSGSSLISSRTSFQIGGKQSRHLPFLGGGKRFYYVDRYRVEHFKPRGPKRWFQNPRTVIVVAVVGSGVLITVYYGNLETVPYTKRKHLVLLSKKAERQIGEAQFQQLKAAFKGKILPVIHPESVRVKLIASDIIEALQRGLSRELAWRESSWREVGYGKETTGVSEGSFHETLLALHGGPEGKMEVDLGSDDEILDDKWVEQNRKKGQKLGSHPTTDHLEGLNWEVIVVNEPIVNAFCLPGGKIVVFTGLLDHFRSNAEIATVIGHEVAHAVARHHAEQITKNLWLVLIQLVLLQFMPMPDLVTAMSHLLLRLPFSRRMEMEADYIGLLLTASAGYDPRVAPKVYEKLGKITGDSAWRNYLSTHPSGKKRAELLRQAKVMEEALTLYMEAKAGRAIEGFFL